MTCELLSPEHNLFLKHTLGPARWVGRDWRARCLHCLQGLCLSHEQGHERAQAGTSERCPQLESVGVIALTSWLLFALVV